MCELEKEDLNALVCSWIEKCENRLRRDQKKEIYEIIMANVRNDRVPENVFSITPIRGYIDFTIDVNYLSDKTLLDILLISKFVPGT